MNKLTLLVLSCVLISCDERNYTSDLEGIKTIHINISHENLVKLNMTSESKVPYPAELIFEENKYHIQLSYSGNSTIDDFKKSYNILFENDDFNYNSYRLSAQSVDESFLKSLLSHKVLSDLGILTFQQEPVGLNMNQKFRGLYVFMEPIDEDFFERRGVQSEVMYKAKTGVANFKQNIINDPRSGFSVKHGEFFENEIVELVKIANENKINKVKLKQIVNYENLKEFILIGFLLQNYDTFDNNYFMYRIKNDPRLMFISWDLDKVYNCFGKNEFIFQYIKERNLLIQKILNDEEMYSEFKNELIVIFNNQMTDDYFDTVIDQLVDQIQDGYERDIVLGGRGLKLIDKAEELKYCIKSWRHWVIDNL